MSGSLEAPETPYPPAPWRLAGQAWVGLFRTDAPVPLPAGLRHVVPSRLVVVALVRYRAGTLRYDELAIGLPARRGPRVGLWVSQMWVNDRAALWGGRRVWGLPKQLADFAWDGDLVRVSDADGPIATLEVDRRPARLPWLWLPAPGFGCLDRHRTYFVATLWARLGRAGLQLEDWSPRFPYRPATTPLVAVAAKPFRVRVPAPTLLGD